MIPHIIIRLPFCLISVRFRPVEFMNAGKLLGFRHAYLLTTDRSGKTHHFSGGPDNGRLNAWGPSDYGPSVGDDFQTDPSKFKQISLVTFRNCDFWDDKFKQTVEYTRSANVVYHWYGPSSNSFVAQALRDANLRSYFNDQRLANLLDAPFNADLLEYNLEPVIPGWGTSY